MKPKKPIMIGANLPKMPGKRCRRFDTRGAAQQFNDAFDLWAQRDGRTHLGYPRERFAR